MIQYEYNQYSFLERECDAPYDAWENIDAMSKDGWQLISVNECVFSKRPQKGWFKWFRRINVCRYDLHFQRPIGENQ